jgi:opacity protein-like surface antigen
MRNTKMTGFVAVTALVFSSALAFGQSAEQIQLAISNSIPAAGTATVSNSDIRDLRALIETQQMQINELKRTVNKLQNQLQALEPIASAGRILPPPVEPSPDPAPIPAPAPAPAPSPAPAPAVATNPVPREILPDIGYIGAEVGLLLGGSTNPYQDNKGFAAGGFIDLPLKNFRSTKLSYEIMVGLQQSQTPQQTTSGVNILANAVVNSYLGNTAANSTSLTSYLTGPLPVTSNVQEYSKVLTVAPVLLKYSINSMGRFRPYVVAGLGMYVWIGNDNNTQSFNANMALGSLAGAPVAGGTLGGVLNSILQGSQIGGLVPGAPQLTARGVPQGQGNLMFGGQFGGGFELRISPKYSIGIDVRRNQVEGTNSSFTSFSVKQGLHW